MKILKIENNKGFFNVTENDNWIPIDQITKDDLMKLLNTFLENDVEIDSPTENEISNQAHQIIYNSIWKKLDTLKNNKGKFRDEAERAYHDAIQKYSETQG